MVLFCKVTVLLTELNKGVFVDTHFVILLSA